MSLFNTLNTGASGLSVNSTNLGVIGDNIANINTIGFKGSRARFADMMPADIYGLGGINQVGTGSRNGQVATSFGQGSLEASSSVLDMGISGKGFFALSTGENTYYTRDGTFYMDTEGYIVSAGGLRLQGYQATDGELTTLLGDLQISQDPVAGQATTAITLTANLSAESAYIDADGNLDTPLADLDIESGGVSIEEAAAAADYATSITAYDSLGVPREVTILFERTGEGSWSWSAVVDAGELSGAGADDAGNAHYIEGGELSFDENGTLTGATSTPATGAWNFEAAADMDLSFLFGADGDEGGLTMTGSDSTVSAISQDGYKAGELTGLDIDAEGVITGVYDNGETLILGQVALATFASDAGLERSGGNVFTATKDAGAAAMGVPDSGGRGTVNAYALEKSNVNLEDEFVYMIEAQRAYQSNARVITTANETLQELVNLV